MRIIRCPSDNLVIPSKPEYRVPKPEYWGAPITLVPEPDRGYIDIQRLGTVLVVTKRPGFRPAQSRQ